MSQASCSALNQYFSSESGRIVADIQTEISGRNLIVDKTERGPFPDGMGYIINVLTTERSFTADADDAAWTAIVPSTGSGNNACLPDVSQISFGQTKRQFQLYRKAVESPDLCLEDLRTEFEIDQQLGNSVMALSDGIQWELEKQAQNMYMSNSGNLVTANSDAMTNISTNGTFAHLPPTSVLTQGILDNIYLQMIRQTYGRGSVGKSGAASVYALVCSPETSRYLIQQNADIRQDWRFAFEGSRMESPLLMPYGVDRSYGNYAHVVYEKMPRYDIVNNILTRRNYWVSTATTQGLTWNVNPQYLSAAYEVSFIWNPMVYKWLVPGNLDAPGGGTRFSTPDYFPATMQWKNIPNRTCNPDDTIGFFRSVLAMAPMPLFPSYGWCVLANRCAPLLAETTCGQT